MTQKNRLQSGPATNLISGWLFVIAAAVITVPWAVGQLHFAVGDGLRVDLAGLIVMHHLFVEHVPFGTEVAYPYGPYLFLMVPIYWPGTYWFIILSRLLVSVAIALGMWRLGQSLRIWNPVTAILAFFSVVFIYYFAGAGFINFTGADNYLFFIIPLLMYVYITDERRPVSAEAYLLAVAAAPIALARFSTFMVFAIIFALTVISDIGIRRRPPFLALTFVAALIAAWLIAGQSLETVPDWIATSYLMGEDFTSAMGVGFLEPHRLIEAGIFILSSIILFAVHFFVLRARGVSIFENLLFLLGLLLLLYVSYKHGIVRHDAHARGPAADYIGYGGILLAIAVATFPSFRRLLVPGAAIIFVFVANYTIYCVYAGIPNPAAYANAMKTHLTAMLNPFAVEQKAHENFEAELDYFQANMKLPDLEGTVDQWPDNAVMPLLAGFDFKTRPSFMSFSVYSEAVGQLNARFLDGPDAPDHMIFQIATIDGRLPAIDDPLGWMAMIRNYDVSYVWNENLMILDHRSEPRVLSSEVIADTEIGWGESLEIAPASVSSEPGQFITMTVEPKPSLLGKLLTLAYKPPELWIEVTYLNGSVERYRLVEENARLGFVISPVIVDLHTAAQVFDMPNFSSPREVASVRLVQQPEIGFAYEPEIKVTLTRHETQSSLETLPTDEGGLQMLALGDLKVLSAGPIPPVISGGIPDVNWLVLSAHAPTTLSVDVDDEASNAEIGFGMLPGSVAGASGDGVTFRVIGKINSSDESDVLMEQHLDPAHEPADAGTKTEVITFRPGAYQELVLETAPGPAENYDYDQSYWSEVEFR